MGLVAVTLVGGLVAAWARGGRLARLAAARFAGGWLLVVAATAALAATTVARSGAGYAALLAASAACAVVFLLRNRRAAGVPLVTLGLVLNAAVVVAAGGMPVSAHAARRAGVALDAVAAGRDAKHRLADAGTPLRVLGDVVPVPLPWRPEVVSPGDVLVAAGVGLLVFAGMRRRPAQQGAPGMACSPSVSRGGAEPRRSDGEEVPEAQGTGEAQGEPRQAAERLALGSKASPSGAPGAVAPVATRRGIRRG